MILELIEEKKYNAGPFFGILKDGLIVNWFNSKAEAEKYYNDIIADPTILNPVRNVLQSQEIGVSLES